MTDSLERQPDPPLPDSSASEPLYGRPQGAVPPATPALPQQPAPVGAPQVSTFPVSFTGTAAEFFRIWIVNLALTVVTLGFYLPWARVRTRQYFYGNTWLDGHNFEYTASPWALLRGYVIVAVLFGAYNAAMQFQFQGWQWVVGIVVVVFVALYPWLIRQSMRFLARSTVHRGLNFRFTGTLGDAYVSYGLANLAAGIAFPAFPWAWFMQRRYQVQGLAYGQAKGHFRGELGPFYTTGLIGFGMTLLGGIGLFVLVGVVVAGMSGFSLERFDEFGPGMIAGLVAVYLAFILLYLAVWQYVRAALMKYVLNNVELGGVVRLSATFNPWTLVGITVTNALAQLVTLGLLTPWAAIRRMNYLAPHIQVRTITNLDDFTAEAGTDETALGEAATELLDIDLGF